MPLCAEDWADRSLDEATVFNGTYKNLPQKNLKRPLVSENFRTKGSSIFGVVFKFRVAQFNSNFNVIGIKNVLLLLTHLNTKFF
jgi:hypothetical protein